MSILGLFSSFVSILLGIYYLIKYLTGPVGIEVQGWTTIVLLIIFYSGMILFSFGLIGEYLIRIIKEVSGHPRYTIRDKL